jgi:hypothetical protein
MSERNFTLDITLTDTGIVGYLTEHPDHLDARRYAFHIENYDGDHNEMIGAFFVKVCDTFDKEV